MRKAYIVTVDINDSAFNNPIDDTKIAIAVLLNSTSYLSNTAVTLAPDSFQPINNVEGNKEE
jgi:hypothetical protein